MPGATDDIKAWYSHEIGKVRVAWSDGTGGAALDADEARTFREELTAAIDLADG